MDILVLAMILIGLIAFMIKRAETFGDEAERKTADRIIGKVVPSNDSPTLTRMIQFHEEDSNGIVDYEI